MLNSNKTQIPGLHIIFFTGLLGEIAGSRSETGKVPRRLGQFKRLQVA